MKSVARFSFKVILQLSLLAAVLVAVLFGSYALSFSSPEWLQVLAREIQAACRDAGTQWMVVACLLSYLIVFVVLEAKSKVAKTHTSPRPDSFPTGVVEGDTNSTPHPNPSPPAPLPSAGRGWRRTLPDRGGEGGVFAFCAFFRGQLGNPHFWLAGFVLLVLLRYALDYANAAKSLQVVILLTGIVIGKGIALWVAWAPRPSLKSNVQGPKSEENTSSGCATFSPSAAEKGIDAQLPTRNHASAPSSICYLSSSSRQSAILGILILLLAGASLWHPERGMEFFYRGQQRWTGPWDNPNLFGVLMGVGLTLALGQLVVGCKSPVSFRSCISWLKILYPILLFSAAGMCAYGLIKSYSRGAWLGTAVGIGFLLCKWVNHEIHEPHESQERSESPLPASGHPLPARLGEGGGAHGVTRSTFQFSCLSCVSWLRTHWLPCSILIISTFVICFWQFRHTEAPLARRLFSVGNVNDFSWRNRVAAWKGAGRMMLDKPFAGFGWGKAEEVYSKHYRVERLEESAAIQMNDYLMIGISAGMPALACFVAYVALGLRRSNSGPRQWAIGDRGEPSGLSTINAQLSTPTTATVPSLVTRHPSLPTICFAGAIVVAVGFWFDGGLFKLPTAVVFWVLIELAGQGGLTTKDTNHTKKPLKNSGTGFRVFGVFRGPTRSAPELPISSWLQVGLRWLVGGVAVVALALTALHLLTPQLTVSDRTLAVARRFLVPAQEQSDFEYLAAKPIWANQPLKVLLQHAHLANYNRTLVNWKLDDDLYREFVLSPEIIPSPNLATTLAPPNGERAGVRGDDALNLRSSTFNLQPSGDQNWRRPLWEFFYPRLRKESNLEAAAEIVMRRLREQVKPSQTADVPTTVLESWQRGAADAAMFQRLTVAALRSVGIPARLSAPAPAEFWNGAEWKQASPAAAGDLRPEAGGGRKD